MKTRKSWTIIQTHEVTVRRSLSSYAAYCPRCCRLNRTVDVSEAVLLRGGSMEMFNDLLNADGRETDLVTRPADESKNPAHFLGAEDDGQFLLWRRPHDAEDVPVATERIFIEETNTANGDGHGVAGVVFDILEEEKVLAQFCLADEVR